MRSRHYLTGKLSMGKETQSIAVKVLLIPSSYSQTHRQIEDSQGIDNLARTHLRRSRKKTKLTTERKIKPDRFFKTKNTTNGRTMRPQHFVMDRLSCRDYWKDRQTDKPSELLIKVLLSCKLICSYISAIFVSDGPSGRRTVILTDLRHIVHTMPYIPCM